MNNTAKKTLLERKFTSVEYMTKYVNLYQQMVFNLKRGMDEFDITYKKNPKLDAHNFAAWENRGLPNLEGDRAYAIDALNKAKAGDFMYIRGSAGNLRGISKDVDNIGGFGEWWQHIDKKYEDNFNRTLDLAQTKGSNIYWSLRGSWNDDEILRETITGPIDETELLNYLKPNEKLEDIS